MPSLHRAFAILTAIIVPLPASALSIGLFNTPVTEDFDSLATSGTSGILPAGWSLAETGSLANPTYAAGYGNSAIGNTYSFGVTGDTDRALGTLRSGAVIPSLGVVVWNQTGGTITDLRVAYTGEQWRLGATGRNDRLDFAYSLDATSLNTGAWTGLDELDFVAPITTGAVGALNGNAPANQIGLSHQLSGLSLVPGASLWLRWTDFDAAGSDDGLGIDDFSIMAVRENPVPVTDSLPPATGILTLGGFVLLASRFRPFSSARLVIQ